MDVLAPIRTIAPADPDAGRGALVEIDVAIELVLSGAARRVRLTALPFVDSIAAVSLARANAAGLAFAFERAERPGVATLTVGPVDPRLPGG